MGLLECDSFHQLARQEGVAPPTYEGTMKAMEAVDLLENIQQMGNRVLRLAQGGVLSMDESNALLRDLLSFYGDPLPNSRGVARMLGELRRYN